MAEVTPKYKTWDEYVKAFQEHGWWCMKDIEPRNPGHVPPLPDRRDARTRPRVVAALDYTAGKGIGDSKPGWFTPTMKCRRSGPPSWNRTILTTREVSHLHRAAYYSKDGDRIKEYPLTATTGRRIPVYFHSEHVSCPGAASCARAARGDQPEDGRRVRHRAGRLGVDRNPNGARSAKWPTCTTA